MGRLEQSMAIYFSENDWLAAQQPIPIDNNAEIQLCPSCEEATSAIFYTDSQTGKAMVSLNGKIMTHTEWEENEFSLFFYKITEAEQAKMREIIESVNLQKTEREQIGWRNMKVLQSAYLVNEYFDINTNVFLEKITSEHGIGRSLSHEEATSIEKIVGANHGDNDIKTLEG